MLSTIIRKEMLLNLVSFRFMVSIALLGILIVGSMQIMAVNYGRRLQDFSTSSEMHNSDLRNINSRPAFEAFGVTGDPRPIMLGIFAIGADKEMSRSFMIPGFAMNDDERGDNGRMYMAASKLVGVMPEGSKYTNPVFMLFMPPDFVYVINIVLSLLALLFAFDTISGEKEDQTLKLMLTNSVPRDIILIGKWIGGTLSILLPFILAFGLGVFLVAIRPDVKFTQEAPMRVFLIMAVSILYISIFYLMGMMFSTFSARSSTSLIMSLFAWVIFVLVIPNIAPVIARQIQPLRTPDQIVREAERIEKDLRKEDGKKAKEEIPGRVKDLEDRWLRGLDNQIKLAMNISRISPSANFIYAATTLSGTGIEDYDRLKLAILKYRQDLSGARKDFLQNDTTKLIPMLYVKIDGDAVPKFDYKPFKLSSALNKVMWDFGILLIYLILLFMISFVRFMRYDVK